MLVADVHRLDHVHVESAEGAQAPQRLHVPAPPSAESVIVPDHQLAHLAAVEQDPIDELLGAQPREPPVEPDEEHVIERQLRQDLAPLGIGREERRRRLRVHDLERMGLEGHQNAGAPRRVGPARNLAQHRLVAQVDAVERADRHGAPARERRKPADHGDSSTTDGRSQPSAARATATSSPRVQQRHGPLGAIAGGYRATVTHGDTRGLVQLDGGQVRAAPCDRAAPRPRVSRSSGTASATPQPADRLAPERGQVARPRRAARPGPARWRGTYVPGLTVTRNSSSGGSNRTSSAWCTVTLDVRRIHALAAPRQPVAPLTVHVLRRISWRPLGMRTQKPAKRLPDRCARRGARPPPAPPSARRR